MQPNLAQVLNTLAHEIRTPLAVSQGYLKLLVDGRITNADDARRAMEQTRQALGALATLCMDMGKVSALSDDATTGVPTKTAAADFIANLQTLEEVKDAAWHGEAGQRAIQSTNARELAQAVAIVAKAAFDEQKDLPRVVKIDGSSDLIVLAGSENALPSLPSRPDAPNTRPVDFVKGGKGLKLIWAAFVLDKHGVQAWADTQHRASVGIRIPLVQA
jgi:signal transduction histidine kinase